MKVFKVNGKWIKAEDMTEDDWKVLTEELERSFNEWVENKEEV